MSDWLPAGYVAFPPVAPDIYGQILSARDVRQAMLATIQAWAPAYVAEVAHQTGLALVNFGSWEAQYEYRALPGNQTPACWTTCTTTDPRRPPAMQGDGSYRAVWVAEANVVVYGADWQEAADLIAAYESAVRAAVLQHGQLGGLASNTRWVGSASKEVEHQRSRTVMVACASFAVTVDGMVNAQDGPKSLPAPPPATQGNEPVESVHIEVDNYQVDQGLPD